MDHVATMRRSYELINTGDIDGFGEFLAEDFVEHEQAPGLAPTKAGVLEFFRMYRAAFPDLRFEPQDYMRARTRSSSGCARRGRTRAASSWACRQPGRASRSS